MSKYEYNQVPNLAKRTVDMANASIIDYHQNRSAFDSVFSLSVLRSQERVHLELIKMNNPNKTVADEHWKFGFVSKSQIEFNSNLDAERLLAKRHALKAENKFAEADAIRNQLESWGYEIGDEPAGTNWIAL